MDGDGTMATNHGSLHRFGMRYARRTVYRFGFGSTSGEPVERRAEPTATDATDQPNLPLT
jgi:hypothetical protein